MEVTIGDRRLKMIDGEICIRAIRMGKETTKETWNKIMFHSSQDYYKSGIKINGERINALKHRLVYKFYHPDWDILDTSTNNQIDHINGNSLDNRIENLRVVTQKQNMWNQTKAKGYSLRPNGKYQARIKVECNLITIGTYDTEQEAHQAYIKAKLKYHIIV
jgi:hypothetical protein